MITITITETEKKRLLFYAENEMESGHWGSSNIEIPQENILYNKIIQIITQLELSFKEAELLFNWFLNATDHGLILLADDISIIHKIVYKIYQYYEITKNKYINEMNSIVNIIDASIKILPDHKFKLPIEHLRELEAIENRNALKLLHDDIYGKSSEIESETPNIHPEDVKERNDEITTEKTDHQKKAATMMDTIKSIFKSNTGSAEYYTNNPDIRESIDAKELLTRSRMLSKK